MTNFSSVLIKSKAILSFAVLAGLLALPLFSWTQSCPFHVQGYVRDAATNEPLEFVDILIEGTTNGTMTDERGFFHLSNFCQDQSYCLIFSRVGNETQHFFIKMNADSTLRIAMNSSVELLKDVVITGKSSSVSSQYTPTLSAQTISDNASQNLSTMLESMAGISTLKNGNGIAKPIVHGLYGNRLTILNNGIAQSGQQWGNDHSPEIDPLVANSIRVIEGANSLAYAKSNLGSVILVEPKAISRSEQVQGKASYFFESNGLGNGLHTEVEQYTTALAWKISGTVKKSGDRKTPTYFLNNTGSEEANFALQLEKSWSKKWLTDIYFSSFNTNLGVLRGSHIGNLTDLYTAFDRATPFFTESNFSYAIDAPKQKVNHQLLKAHSQYLINSRQWLDLTVASQLNVRKEFDVRRSGLSEVPALSLSQWTHTLNLAHKVLFANDLRLNTGISGQWIDNSNNSETGILPLVPDYRAYETGVFVVASRSFEKTAFELGARYDNVAQKVYVISQSLPREILFYHNNFHNFSSDAGAKYTFDNQWTLAYNLGFATRNPAINELYSNGLHQGVSGIEEGDADLRSEQALKHTFSVRTAPNRKSSLEAVAYFQNINDYIYLQPQNEVRLTIRGAFPVFRYEQTNAQIYGLDFSGKTQLAKAFYARLTYSFLKGQEVQNDLPLINMPSNSVKSFLSYESPMPISLGKRQLNHLKIEVQNTYVFQQKNLLPEQDFVLPPDAYTLFGGSIGADVEGFRQKWRVFAKVDNLFNVQYRDYLNRQRYFANDLGINATLNVVCFF